MAQCSERKYFSSGNISGKTKVVFVEGTSGTGKSTVLGRLESQARSHMGLEKVIVRQTEYSWMVERYPNLKNKHLSAAMGQVYTATKKAEVVELEHLPADYVVIDRSPFSGMLYDYLWAEINTGVEKLEELTRALLTAIELGWWQSNYKMLITIVDDIPKCLDYMKSRNNDLDLFHVRYIELQNKYMNLLATILPRSDVVVHRWSDHVENNEDLMQTIRCLGGINFINNPGRCVSSDAGIDLPLAHDVDLAKGETTTALTTVTAYLSPYHSAVVIGRSSANKVAAIALGLIDSYYGEPLSIYIRALEDVHFKAGQSVAQLVIQERPPIHVLGTSYPHIKMVQKQRGGFGSTNEESNPRGYIHSDNQSFPVFN